MELTITDKRIYKMAIVKAPKSRVWWAWTTTEGVEAFVAPKAHIELKVGGKYEWYFITDAPEGLQGSETCKVLSYLPEQMLSFSWNAPPDQEFVRNHTYRTWVVIQLTDTPEGFTLAELSHIGWPEGEPWNVAYDYFNEAWGFVMQRLQQYFEK